MLWYQFDAWAQSKLKQGFPGILVRMNQNDNKQEQDMNGLKDTTTQTKVGIHPLIHKG